MSEEIEECKLKGERERERERERESNVVIDCEKNHVFEVNETRLLFLKKKYLHTFTWICLVLM